MARVEDGELSEERIREIAAYAEQQLQIYYENAPAEETPNESRVSRLSLNAQILGISLEDYYNLVASCQTNESLLRTVYNALSTSTTLADQLTAEAQYRAISDQVYEENMAQRTGKVHTYNNSSFENDWMLLHLMAEDLD